MRTRTKSIVTAFVLLSLVSGAIGCRSNGGPWYNPKTYSWHNPFSKSSEAPAFASEGTAHANTKPNIGAQPDVNVPPGGYTNKKDEADFMAGRKEGAVMVPQYGTADMMDNSRVATTTGMPGSAMVHPETPVYNPYAVDQSPAVNQQVVYQDTNLHTAGAPHGAPQNGMYSAPVDPMVYPGMAPAATQNVNPGTPNAAPANGYSPYANPAPTSAPIYGEPATTAAPYYGQPAATPQSFGAQPTVPQTGYAAPQSSVAPQQGYYGAPVTSVPASNMPSIYPSSTPQGF